MADTKTAQPTFDDSTDRMLRTLWANGIYRRSDITWFTKFNRFGCMDPYNRLENTREYVFFTKPDLHIFSARGVLNPQISNMPIFRDLYDRGYDIVMDQLQLSMSRTGPFMAVLTNAKMSNLDLPGISADDMETSSNLYGTKMHYRKSSDASDENFDFSIDFEDTKYGEVYALFKMYDEYQRKKFHGIITPPNKNYILYKILHDQISIFKFLVDDQMNIVFSAKLYGCYPKTVPRDTFSELPTDGGVKFTVQWKCSFVEDSEPNIISDFNALTDGLGGAEAPVFDADIGAVSGEWVTAPYITYEKAGLSNFGRYKLRWRK